MQHFRSCMLLLVCWLKDIKSLIRIYLNVRNFFGNVPHEDLTALKVMIVWHSRKSLVLLLTPNCSMWQRQIASIYGFYLWLSGRRNKSFVRFCSSFTSSLATFHSSSLLKLLMYMSLTLIMTETVSFQNRK